MGRPAKFSRDEAVEIAMNTFWAKGYSAVSVSELAEAMNITRSSFYNSFKTREAIFDEALALYAQSAPDYFLASLPENSLVVPEIYKALRHLCKARSVDPDARGCMIINCIAQASVEDEAAPKLFAVMETKIDRFQSLLERAQQNGELSLETDARTAAKTIVNHMVGLNLMCKILRTEDELWSITETMLAGLGIKEAA